MIHKKMHPACVRLKALGPEDPVLRRIFVNPVAQWASDPTGAAQCCHYENTQRSENRRAEHRLPDFKSCM